MLPSFRAALTPKRPALELADLPLLDTWDEPVAIAARYLQRPGGGFRALLAQTRGLALWPTLWYFVCVEWRPLQRLG